MVVLVRRRIRSEKNVKEWCCTRLEAPGRSARTSRKSVLGVDLGHVGNEVDDAAGITPLQREKKGRGSASAPRAHGDAAAAHQRVPQLQRERTSLSYHDTSFTKVSFREMPAPASKMLECESWMKSEETTASSV